MNKREALDVLRDGHGILSVESAKRVCETLGFPFAETLIIRWQNMADARQKYGFVPVKNEPGEGVDSLTLSYFLCQHLGIEAPRQAFIGAGRQARANAQAIAQVLSLAGEL